MNNTNYQSFYINFPFGQRRSTEYQNMVIEEIDSFFRPYKHTSCKTILLSGAPLSYSRSIFLSIVKTLLHYLSLVPPFEMSIETDENRSLDIPLLQALGINRIDCKISVPLSSVTKQLIIKLASLFPMIALSLSMYQHITTDEWINGINSLVSLPIHHISISWFNNKNNQKFTYTYNQTIDILEKHNFFRYSTHHFAQKGFESMHYVSFLKFDIYAGFGKGACSFNGNVYQKNGETIQTYMKKEKELTSFIDKKSLFFQKILVTLPSFYGICYHSLLEYLTDIQKEIFLNELRNLYETGFINIKNNYAYLTHKGYAIENEIVARLSFLPFYQQ